VRALEEWIGDGTSVSVVSSCTSGIELAVRTTFRPAPLALVASFTFAGGPLALLACGHAPVFLDIDEVSWQPALAAARDVLRGRAEDVAGILLTATFGVADASIGEWEALAREYEVALVIDNAAGFGAEYPWGERVGARGTCEIFSLHATKTLAVGEGGVVSSHDPEVISTINRLKNFGFDDARRAVLRGINAKLPELSSAMGIRQLTGLSQRIEKRRSLLAKYDSLLRPLGFTFQPGAERSAVAFVSGLIPEAIQRDTLLAALDAAGVECRTYYNPPLHQHPVFTEYAATADLEVTDAVTARILSLPMADNLKVEAVERIAGVARGVING
jgi:dTDP-4-amino-4,6-dideoxygalactose transaminase